MADWPLHGGGNIFAHNQGGPWSNSMPVLLPGADAETWGAWVEVMAPQSFMIGGLDIKVNPGGGLTAKALIEIAVGPSLSEAVIARLPVDHAWAARPVVQLFLPLSIPANTRIAARVKGTNNSATYTFSVFAHGAGPRTVQYPHALAAYGLVEANMTGTPINAAATAHSWGSWTEITSSTDRTLSTVMLQFSMPSTLSGVVSSYIGVDFGYGPPAQEVAVIPRFHVEAEVSLDTFIPHMAGPFAVSIPAGVRLAARAIRAVSGGTTPSILVLGW